MEIKFTVQGMLIYAAMAAYLLGFAMHTLGYILRSNRWRAASLVLYAVGAVIAWQGKFLLFRRRLFPFQYTIVAGHWDSNDPTPEAAITREIAEEAGLALHPAGSPLVETLKDPCRRGADFHEWRLYRFTVGGHQVTMSEEADIIGWYSPEEIRGLDLTIPTEYFFKKLQII